MVNDKQQRFVSEYLVDLNATQAAIRAGYSEKAAGQTAFNLLKKTEIQAAISEAQKARSVRTQVNQDRVIQEIARIGLSDIRAAFSETGSLLPPSEWSDDLAAAVAAMEVERRTEGRGDDAEVYYVTKLKLWDKNSALEKLCKHLGLYEKDNEQQVHALGVIALPVKGSK
ncbi:terminase small subunit [Asaia bogorensis]|uniref:terminase small subunit n=1 Tax=Asaia bogorensis TaxID=91915 RepID=UPI0030184843